MSSVASSDQVDAEIQPLDTPLSPHPPSPPTFVDPPSLEEPRGVTFVLPDLPNRRRSTTNDDDYDIEDRPISFPPPRGRRRSGGARLREDGSSYQNIEFNPAKRSSIWEKYNQQTTEIDSELIEGWNRLIEVILVFASLFSAITTGFVIESSKNLQPDQTVSALHDLARALQTSLNTSTSPSIPGTPTPEQIEDMTQPTTAAVIVNCMWFGSLCLSISVSLLAMLATRWCHDFKSRRVGSKFERAMTRQRSWDAIQRWGMGLVIEQLPTLMHIALLLFFVGLLVYLSEINYTVAFVATSIVGITVAFYGTFTFLPLWFRDCPMVTPFTQTLLYTYRFILEPSGNNGLKRKIWNYFSSSIDNSQNTWIRSRITLLAKYPAFLWQSLPNLRWKTQLSFNFLQHSPAFPDNQDEWPVPDCDNKLCQIRRYELSNGSLESGTPDGFASTEFRAIVWMLNSSNQSETVEHVLEYIHSFPEVIIHSHASGGDLYLLASTALEHTGRLQRDLDEWRSTLSFKVLCARLVYLTMRPWLHQSPRYMAGQILVDSQLSKLGKLFQECGGLSTAEMSKPEIAAYIDSINSKVPIPSDYVSWMEELVGKISIACGPESGLELSSVLGQLLLHERVWLLNSNAEIRPTLWWMFLNCTMKCLPGSFPHDWNTSPTEGAVKSDIMLTLTHFRDSRKRQENACWLAIVGISGLLLSFTRLWQQEGKPTQEDLRWITTLIDSLRKNVRTSLTSASDPFVGELPVYKGSEVRLYQFDSLEYAIDALKDITKSRISQLSIYPPELFDELGNALQDARQLRHLKRVILPEPGKALSSCQVKDYFRAQKGVTYLPDILVTGLYRYMAIQGPDLGRDQAHLLSEVLATIMFGPPGAPTVSDDSESDRYAGRLSEEPLENYAKACDIVATLAWAPFTYDSDEFRDEFSLWYEGNTYRTSVWEPLYDSGLLRQQYTDPQMQPHPDNYGALGYYLYIKAGLLERLYAYPRHWTSFEDWKSYNHRYYPGNLNQDSHFKINGRESRPSVALVWSLPLAAQITQLLPFWQIETMDTSEQVYIITSLMQLVNILLDVPRTSTPPEEVASSQEGSTTAQISPDNKVNTHSYLDELIHAGILSRLAYPFSVDFNFPRACADKRISTQVVWYNDLAVAIDRLVQSFPGIVNEPSLHFTQEQNMTNGDGENGDYSHENQNKFYSDMVAYYETRAPHGQKQQEMLGLVTRLRDSMQPERPSPAPSPQTPAHVHIDMPQELETDESPI